jgi:predicted small lipoprotein YifL
MRHHGAPQRDQPPGADLGRRQLLALLSLALPALAGGCGKQGPLRLPEPEAGDDAADEETR